MGCDGILRVYLCSPSVVSTYAHLPMVDIQPYHIFLPDAPSMPTFGIESNVVNIFLWKVPGTDMQRLISDEQQTFSGMVT